MQYLDPVQFTGLDIHSFILMKAHCTKLTCDLRAIDAIKISRTLMISTLDVIVLGLPSMVCNTPAIETFKHYGSSSDLY